jgi:hypothetical protein
MSVIINRRPVRQVKPAHGVARWILPIGEVGTGVLSINGTPYTVTCLFINGQLTGYRLTKEDGTTYDIDATANPWRCDCPDATFHPERPGGCKHCAGLRAALRK